MRNKLSSAIHSDSRWSCRFALAMLMLVSTAPTIAAEEHPEQPFATVDLTVIEQFPGAIEAFVKAGDPNGENIPHWPPMMVDGKQLMESWKVCGSVLVPARGC